LLYEPMTSRKLQRVKEREREREREGGRAEEKMGGLRLSNSLLHRSASVTSNLSNRSQESIRVAFVRPNMRKKKRRSIDPSIPSGDS